LELSLGHHRARLCLKKAINKNKGPSFGFWNILHTVLSTSPASLASLSWPPSLCGLCPLVHHCPLGPAQQVVQSRQCLLLILRTLEAGHSHTPIEPLCQPFSVLDIFEIVSLELLAQAGLGLRSS
jgi:hypothetical protein